MMKIGQVDPEIMGLKVTKKQLTQTEHSEVGKHAERAK